MVWLNDIIRRDYLMMENNTLENYRQRKNNSDKNDSFNVSVLGNKNKNEIFFWLFVTFFSLFSSKAKILIILIRRRTVRSNDKQTTERLVTGNSKKRLNFFLPAAVRMPYKRWNLTLFTIGVFWILCKTWILWQKGFGSILKRV